MEAREVLKRFEISLDVAKSISNREFTVIEGDTGNVLVILLSDNGEPVDLMDCRVIAAFSKSNGTAAQDSEQVDGGITLGGAQGNEITIELFVDSFAPGMVECELQIYSGTGYVQLVTSAKFNFSCRKGILNEETVTSSNEYPFLIKLIEQCEELTTQETVRCQNEETRQAAERLRQALYNLVKTTYDSDGFKGEKGDTAGNSVLSGADTDMTGMLKGDGELVQVAVAGTDYILPPLVCENRAVSGFMSDTTYPGYSFRAFVPIAGADAAMRPEVIFSVSDAVSGNYAPAANGVANGIYVYSKTDNAVTIPLILLWR